MTTDDNRCISPDFLDSFIEENGPLEVFLKTVQEDESLELCFRDSYVEIYYKNQRLWKISERDRKGLFKVEVSLITSIEESERLKLANDLKTKYKNFIIYEKNGALKRYPYIIMPSFEKGFVEETSALLKRMLDKYFVNKKGEDVHKEKERQQQIFTYLSLKDKKDGFYAYDMEFHQKYPDKIAKLSDGKQNEPDIFAIRYLGGVPQSLVLVEVKSTPIACEDTEKNPGIISHINGMFEYIKSSYMENRKVEACDILNAYKKMGLHETPEIIPETKDLCKAEMIMILTDKAVEYYYDHKELIDNNKKDCIIYEWSEKQGLNLLSN